ncbi:MAG: amino acid--tRNA ligase-related protein [Desulfatiglandales bacterium]
MSRGQNEIGDGLRLRIIEKRARILRLVREFFQKKGYVEVETPILIPYPIPEANIDPPKAEGGYLHPSPELCMKMLLSCGLKKIYQITRCFRKGEEGRYHMVEFTMLEFYEQDKGYHSMMELLEELIGELVLKVEGREKINYRGFQIDLTPPWPRIPFGEFFERITGLNLEKAIQENIFEDLLTSKVEPSLPVLRPCFLVDYPAQLASLARLKDPHTAERFELYMGGLELATGFSGLLDPHEQLRRFIAENEKRASMGKEIYPISESFLSAISKIDEAAGVALGIDRLMMILLNQDEISLVQPLTYKDLIP